MVSLLAEPPRARRRRTYTVAEVLDMTGDRILELYDGMLEEKDVANKAAQVAFETAIRLNDYRKEHGGVLIPPEGFFRLGDDRQLRRPDTGFVIKGRLPGDDLGDGALLIAPDLIVEVISPRDNAEKVEKKLTAYLAFGVRMIWAVYPRTGTVRVIRPGGRDSRFGPSEVLDGEDVLPGLRIAVADILGLDQGERAS